METGDGARRTRISARQLAPDAAFLLGSNTLQALAAFGANLVLVRFIAPEGFGEYALALATISLALSICTLRVGVLIIRMPEESLGASMRTLLYNALVHETVIGGAIGFAWLGMSGLLTPWSLLLLVSLLLRHFGMNGRAFFERGMPYRRLARIEGGSHLLAYAVSVVLVVSGFGVAALYVREALLSVLLLGTLASVGGLPRYPLRFIRPREWPSILKQARGIWADGTLENGFMQVVVLLAGFFGGATGAGFFFQAQRLAVTPHQMIQPIVGRLSLNWFSREEDSHARRVARNRILLIAAVPLVVSSAVTFAFADQFVPFLLGDRWADAVPVLVSLCGFILFASLFEVLKMYFFAAHQTRRLLVARVAQYLGMFVVLGFFYGAGGVDEISIGLGVSLAYATAFAVGALYARK